ncbi:MAG TPA: HEAT repeat domain-containing protein, partial [Pyrinomonadaceae bacterium]|nr:HEAT repeat domain-containing protein [Pyrinomonadaceae bacterium]
GGRVHVVSDLNWCGTLSSNVIGCADTPGGCMIVVRDDDPAIEAVLWAHEFGHNRGLDHRDVNDAVMHSIIETTHRRLTQAECSAFRGPSAGSTGGETRRMPAGRGEPPMDIKEFVRRRYVHGVPYEQASSYPAEVVPTLLEMLRDPAERAHRANIVATLGMIGDPRAVRPLLELFAEGEGQLSNREYKLRKAIVVSLGYLLNKTDDREVLEFLLEGLNPDSWSRTVKWDSPADVPPEHTQSQLTKMAIWGLALSGKTEAREALLSLQQGPAAALSAAPGGLLANVTREAIDVNSTVAEKGLAGYHER